MPVVVVTYSPGESLDDFLDSLTSAIDGDVDVVLADNGSTDGSPEGAASARHVPLVGPARNLGYGRAANIGVAATSSGYVLIANPDIGWRPGRARRRCSPRPQRWPRRRLARTIIYTVDGDIYPSARALPSLGPGIGHALSAVVAVQPVDGGLPA